MSKDLWSAAGPIVRLCLPLLLASGALPAIEFQAPPSTLTRSSSGQFLVSTRVLPPLRPALAPYASNSAYVVLEPAFLTVSCERIRSAFLREIQSHEPWQGNVFITLFPAQTTNDTVIIRTGSPPRWQYQVELPHVVERQRFVTAITQALLLEMSNRHARERSAEIPLWLSEGLARHLVSSSGVKLVLTSPSALVNGVAIDALLDEARGEHPLKAAHAVLAANGASSFQELSWPEESSMKPAERQRFAASSQVLVHDLLALPNGKAAFREMLGRLPQFLNWQFAFLQAFREHFQRPLDVEKWWSLHATCFAERDLAQTWPADEGFRKFAEILRAPFELQTGTNSVPLHGETSLQAVLRTWAPAQQFGFLRHKAAQLEAFALRVPPDLASVAMEYRSILLSVVPPDSKKPETLSPRKADALINALNRLDERRAALQNELQTGAIRAGPSDRAKSQVPVSQAQAWPLQGLVPNRP